MLTNNNSKRFSMSRILTVALVLIFIFILYIIYCFNELNHAQKEEAALARRNIESMNISLAIRDSSDILTNAITHFVVTLDKSYVDVYLEEITVADSRGESIRKLDSLQISKEEKECLSKAKVYSDKLAEQELWAIKLIFASQGIKDYTQELASVKLSDEELALSPEKMIEAAKDSIFSQNYAQQKIAILNEIEQFQNLHFHHMQETTDEASAKINVTFRYLIILVIILLLCLFALFVMLYFKIISPVISYTQKLSCYDDFTQTKDFSLSPIGSNETKILGSSFNQVMILLRQEQEKLRQLAEIEGMTGLYNRGTVEALMRQEIKTVKSYALIILDIDNLKQINDMHGHAVGDIAIKEVAEILKSHFQDNSIVGRFGGDEFIVFLPDAKKELELVHSLDSLKKKINSIKITDHVTLSCSMGISLAINQDDFNIVYKQADMALYKAKRNRKNTFVFYSQEEI